MSELVRLDDLFDGTKTVSDIVSRLKQCEQPDIKHEHRFTGGMYCRTFFPKANTFVVGKIHKFAGVNMLLSGAVTIYDGETTQYYKAPQTFITKGNDQKVGYFTEDSEFAFICTCFSDNVEDAEKELFYDDHIPIESVKAWEHYNDMLVLTNQTEEEVQALVNFDNLLLDTLTDFELKPSPIHGTGFFTTRSYSRGELIGRGLVEGKRTELGRWVNNTNDPNTYYSTIDIDNGNVCASRAIEAGEELTLNYIDNLIKQKELL